MKIFENFLKINCGRELAVVDSKIFTEIAKGLPNLHDNPDLLSVTKSIDIYFEKTNNKIPEDVANELHKALSDTSSPTIYRDTVDIIINSAKLLDVLGSKLAASSFEQGCQLTKDATLKKILRAADAFEIAVQLRLRNYAKHWDLFDYLDKYDVQKSNSSAESYHRAVLRAAVVCAEQWEDGEELAIDVISRIAGLNPQLCQDSMQPPNSTLNDEDLRLSLTKIATIQALRANNRDSSLEHLERAVKIIEPILDNCQDNRPDIFVAIDIVTLLKKLFTNDSIGSELVHRIKENVRELIHLDPGRKHWVGDRVAASHQAWALLSAELDYANKKFSKLSWYDSAKITDSVINFYQTINSRKAFQKTSDNETLQVIIEPIIEKGFATNLALFQHLQDHVNWLKECHENGEATQKQSKDLEVASKLISKITKQMNTENTVTSTNISAPLKNTCKPVVDYSTIEYSIMKTIAEKRNYSSLTTNNLMVDSMIEKAHKKLKNLPEYVGAVQEATNLVLNLLMRFLWDRNQVEKRQAPYLYKIDASEQNLADDLHNFLRASGSLNNINSESSQVAGGRVDIELGFPGFNLYVELKIDTSNSLASKNKKFIGQAAAYTVADQPIGFLFVLKLLKSNSLPPHIEKCLEVEEIDDSNGKLRHIVVLTLYGNKSKPSSVQISPAHTRKA